MRKFAIVAALMLAAVGPRSPAAEPLVEQVRGSIEKGIRFLRNEERGRGNWEHSIGAQSKPGGYTSLALLALLNSGIKSDDPIVQRGLTYLRSSDCDPQFTYVVGLQTMVFAEVGDPRDGPRIQRNVDWLIDSRVLRNNVLRGWGYGRTIGGTDFSNSQYALLGLHAGKQAGAVIDKAVWESIEKYYLDTQDPSGGWGYSFDYGSSVPIRTMTIAGLCGLYITGLELNGMRRKLNADGSDPKCGIYDENEAIARALKCLGTAGSAATFAFRDKNFFYNAYGIERAGRLSGMRFIANYDWYRDGCVEIFGRQQEDGSWLGSGHGENAPTISTSFALLFLSKGRTPVLISKFAHGPADDWNNKHNDCRYLVEYASKELFHKQPLSWQTYDARRLELANRDTFLGEVGNLLQSPILYMNGHQAPRLTDVQKKLLMQYVDEGGFLFAEACCGRPEFADGFRKLMAELFPDSPLKPLAPGHPLWTAHAQVPPGFVALEGIEKGCKTVVVFSPQPLAGYWEINDRKPLPQRGLTAFRLAGNVIAYATGLEMPKVKLSESRVFDPKGEKRSPRGFLKAAQIRHEGDWQPAPRAMPNLMRSLRGEYKLDVTLATEEMRLGTPDLFQFKFLYIHGRNKFEFQPQEIENLRANLKAGGLLLADACCGKAAFDRAFREFAVQLFPEAKLEPIPQADQFYSAEIGGTAITTVRVRKEKPDGSGVETEFRDSPPMLEGIRINGRWVVIYSKYDIGCALENHQSTDCKGYDKASAMKLASAAVLYMLKK